MVRAVAFWILILSLVSCGPLRDISDMNEKMDELNSGLQSMNDEVVGLNTEIEQVSDPMEVISQFLATLGLADGGQLNIDGAFEKSIESLQSSSALRLIPLLIETKKQELAQNGALLYESPRPGNRYIGIGSIVAYGEPTLITALSGISENIFDIRPLTEETLRVSEVENRIEFRSSDLSIAPTSPRSASTPLEWTLSAGGVLRTGYDQIEILKHLPFLSARMLENAAIVVVFMLNEMADHPLKNYRVAKLGDWIGKVLQYSPLNGHRIQGIELQSFMMVEWNLHRMVCEFQFTVERLKSHHSNVPRILQAKPEVIQNLTRLSEVYLPASMKRWLTARGYGPHATPKQKTRLTKQDQRLASTDQILRVLDPQAENFLNLCHHFADIEDYVSRSDSYPEVN